MKINDLIVENWTDNIRRIAGSIGDLVDLKGQRADQVANQIGKRVVQDWARMMQNLEMRYGKFADGKVNERVVREQLMGFAHQQLGVEFWPAHGNPSPQLELISKGTSSPPKGAFSKFAALAFNRIINSTMRGDFKDASATSGFIDLAKEGIAQQQTNQYGVARQKPEDNKSKTEPRTGAAAFRQTDYGSSLVGQDLGPLNDPNSDQYENAIIPMQYLLTTMISFDDDDNMVVYQANFIRYDGKWWEDSTPKDPDHFALEIEIEDEELLRELNRMIATASIGQHSSPVPPDTLHLPFQSATAVKYGQMIRDGKSATAFTVRDFFQHKDAN